MYTGLLDDRGPILLVSLLSGRVSSDHDYAALERDILTARTTAARASASVVWLFVCSRLHPTPPATWRKRLAETRRVARDLRISIAFVTELAVHRGALTAANWIVPPPEWETWGIHADVEAALGWLAGRVGDLSAARAGAAYERLLAMSDSRERLAMR